ncbi:MAG: hypothetical protein B6I18_02395 [Bacteroidetes bacterium 4572_112]|nr:MAG: hypothetical protein B6I18_02395 [Bacteroidetes bacterium 4572_112]
MGAIKAITIVLIMLQTVLSIGQLTINITSVPSNTPMGADLYIAGNFNNWSSGDNNYILSDNSDGTYQITFSPALGNMEFKFTRGDWASVEGSSSGGEIGNRTYNYSGGQQTIDLSIAGWKDGGSSTGTRADNVSILDANFYIPELGRNRRIWIYVPKNYDSTTDSFPVMYMQDGQNLFDVNTSFSGEWEVDESLNTLFDNGDSGIIVVGIDNGGGSRLDEYSPWINAQYGGGEGEQYTNFIINTLKPHIDSNYRTLSDRENTGIMGSSMGALISFYAALEHQDIFSKVGVFSPSFWFSDSVFTHVQNKGKQYDMQFYLMAGTQESSSMIPKLSQMKSTLLNAGFTNSEIKYVTHSDGQHSEWYWRREFPNAYIWLFNPLISSISKANKEDVISVFPNPFTDFINIDNKNISPDSIIKIYNIEGSLILTQKLNANGKINLKSLSKGVYIIKMTDADKNTLSRKIIKL